MSTPSASDINQRIRVKIYLSAILTQTTETALFGFFHSHRT